MGALSVYLGEGGIADQEMNKESSMDIRFEKNVEDPGQVVCEISSKEDIDVTLKAFNLEIPDGDDQLSLDENSGRTVNLTLKIIDPGKPYIALILNENGEHQEAVGAGIEMNY
jgi:hypothetical protein